MQRAVGSWALEDIGIENSQYFQGFGVCGTRYDNSAVGVGNDPREALDDCLEQVAQMGFDTEALERDILKAFPDFSNPDKCAAASVEQHLREDGNPDNFEDDDVEHGELIEQDSELYYHVGLRWRAAHSEAFDNAAQWVAYVVDDAGAGRALGDDVHAIIRATGEQFQFSSVLVLFNTDTNPLGVAVHSYLDVELDDARAIELATDYLREIGQQTGAPIIIRD